MTGSKPPALRIEALEEEGKEEIDRDEHRPKESLLASEEAKSLWPAAAACAAATEAEEAETRADLAAAEKEAEKMEDEVATVEKVLALVFTGGTTRAARCVEVTHAMALHEMRRYREALPCLETPVDNSGRWWSSDGGRGGVASRGRTGGERVLQLSSAYWGAAFLGEIDLAFASGGTLVFLPMPPVPAVLTAPEVWQGVVRGGVTILGAVPALLAQLPAEEAPQTALRTVISWADACPQSVARRWMCAAPTVDFVELLIASEYWLSFCARRSLAEGDRRPVYRPVGGLRYRVVNPPRCGAKTAEEEMCTEGEVGELWIAGPLISPGYRYCARIPSAAVPTAAPSELSGAKVGTGTITDARQPTITATPTVDFPLSGAAASQLPTVDRDGHRFLRTGDVVRVQEGGVVFVGRGDMMSKSGGQWIDLYALEERLRTVHGVEDVAVVTDVLLGPRPEVFVCVHRGQCAPLRSAAECVRALRCELPGGGDAGGLAVGLNIISGDLPRNVATGKLDRRQLMTFGRLGSQEPQAATAGLRAAAAGQHFLNMAPSVLGCFVILCACSDATLRGAAPMMRLLLSTVRSYRQGRGGAHKIAIAGALSSTRVRSRFAALLMVARSITAAMATALRFSPSRFVVAPFVWLSVILGEQIFPAGRRLRRYRLAVFWLLLAAPRSLMALALVSAPGFAWAARLLAWTLPADATSSDGRWPKPSRALAWVAVFWTTAVANTPIDVCALMGIFLDKWRPPKAISFQTPLEKLYKVVLWLFPPFQPVNYVMFDPMGVFVGSAAPELTQKQRSGESGHDSKVTRNWACGDGDGNGDDRVGRGRGSSGFWQWRRRGGWSIVVDDVDLDVRLLEPLGSDTLPESGHDSRRPGEDITGHFAPPTADERELLRLIAHVTGHRPTALRPLAGLDSLSLMALAEALRSERNVVISTALLSRASFRDVNITELLAGVQAAATDATAGACAGTCAANRCHGDAGESAAAHLVGHERSIWMSANMYKSRLNWTLVAPNSLDQPALLRALRRLCQRHPLLRACRESPAQLVEEVNRQTADAAAAVQALAHYLDAGIHINDRQAVAGGCRSANGQSWLLRAIVPRLLWAVRQCWPRLRICASASVQVELDVVDAADEEDGALLASSMSHPFSGPCRFTLFRNREANGRDFLRLSVSHALADAMAFVPLRRDLVGLYLEELGGPKAALQPIPDAVDVLGQRLDEAFSMAGLQRSSGQLPYVGGWEPDKQRVWGYQRLVRIHAGAATALRQASDVLGLPTDLLLLSALAMAVALAVVPAEEEAAAAAAAAGAAVVVPLTVTAPMRDELGEAACVGCFTDWREIDVRVHLSETLLSVAMRIADSIRGRRWLRGVIADTHTRVLVNLVPAHSSTDRGFEHRVDLGCCRPPARSGVVFRTVERAMEVQGWQLENDKGWTLSLRLDGNRYPPEWAADFSEALRLLIERLATEPLTPVHVVNHCRSGRDGSGGGGGGGDASSRTS
eukprot:TRINITY_DN25586_c0_g1_i1.p1 TRINITY_DN25586_c0_g1~~TRINITY_DN25586_c0_g1_i1.p1  ORF type:complete len:1584 (-),score=293.41 TRINITY_DN25586_c0_g1_i1:338-4807(-)